MEESALPLPGKNNCHVGGAQRWLLDNARSERKEKGITLSEQVLGVVPLRQ